MRNATCDNWNDIQDKLYTKSKEYLTDRNQVLGRLMTSVGYKTCHHIDSLDSTICANDCNNFEQDEFAKNCTKNEGLFKCCIRLIPCENYEQNAKKSFSFARTQSMNPLPYYTLKKTHVFWLIQVQIDF